MIPITLSEPLAQGSAHVSTDVARGLYPDGRYAIVSFDPSSAEPPTGEASGRAGRYETNAATEDEMAPERETTE